MASAPGTLAMVWLTLALPGCGTATEDGGRGGSGGATAGGATTNSGGSTGGTGAHTAVGGDSNTGGSGAETAGGQSAGGQSSGGTGGEGGSGLGGDGAEIDGPRASRVRLQDGRWFADLENIDGFYISLCVTEPSLKPQDYPARAAALPESGEYFVDGEYQRVYPNLGCDVRGCFPYPQSVGLFATGYTHEGTLPYTPDRGETVDLPAYESYAIAPPLVFYNRYFTDSTCSQSHLVTPEPVVLTPEG